jgi:hypothetical protein
MPHEKTASISEAMKPMRPGNEPDASIHECNTDKTRMGIKPRKHRNGVGGYQGSSVSDRHCDAGPEAGAPFETGEAGPCEKRRYANRAFTGLSGCRVGYFTGFYRIGARCHRLFPHKSTQVVDFPRITMARLFWEGLNSPQRRRDAEARGERKVK